MAGCCDHAPARHRATGPYRRVLWIALALNAAMFAVELAAGFAAGSVSLQADALDFLGDAATYGITLAVLGMALRWRAGAALLKGGTMGLFGFWVAGATVWHALNPGLPGAPIMGGVGLAALTVNLACAALLFRHREGDSNMRSVWLCSRNDAIGNLAVMAAAGGVWATGSGWPDLAVGAVMASLALWSATQIVRQARGELHGNLVPAAE